MVRPGDSYTSYDLFCVDQDSLSSNASELEDLFLDARWAETPPESPRSSSPENFSDGSTPDFSSVVVKLEPVDDHYQSLCHPAPKICSPVMWSYDLESHSDLPGKLVNVAPPTPSLEAFDSPCFVTFLGLEGVSSDDDILNEIIGDKRKMASVLDADSLEARKAKARRTRDALSAEAQLRADQPENKRITHKVFERKRRNDLKASYVDLRCSIPSLVGSDRASTSTILQKAVEYIEELKRIEREMLAGLAAENERLRAARK